MSAPVPMYPSQLTDLAVNGWHGEYLRLLVLAERKYVKIDRALLLTLIAQSNTSEQVVADLVAMFTETGE